MLHDIGLKFFHVIQKTKVTSQEAYTAAGSIYNSLKKFFHPFYLGKSRSQLAEQGHKFLIYSAVVA